MKTIKIARRIAGYDKDVLTNMNRDNRFKHVKVFPEHTTYAHAEQADRLQIL
jgi:hypothetical protein